MAVRKANAVWEGNLKEGNGNVTTESGVLDARYTFSSRFEEGAGTNPDELLGAALASCFSMFLASVLAGAGHEPKRVSTEARAHLNTTDDGPVISKIELLCEAVVPGLDRSEFLEHAQTSKQNCPVSKTLKGTEVTLDATLVQD